MVAATLADRQRNAHPTAFIVHENGLLNHFGVTSIMGRSSSMTRRVCCTGS